MTNRSGYLVTKRKKNGREIGSYVIRIYVPSAWRDMIGRPDVLLSLGTGDERAANLAAVKIFNQTYSEWQLAVEGPPNQLSSEIDPVALAVKVGYDLLSARLEGDRRTWPDDNAKYFTRLEGRKEEAVRLTRLLQDGRLTQWEEMADRIISTRGIAIMQGSDDYDELVLALAKANIDCLGVFVRRVQGELDAAPQSNLVQVAKAREASIAAPGETLLDLYDKWSAELLAKGEKRPDSVTEGHKVLTLFSKFVGANRNVRSITPLDVASYRDTMRDLPPKWMSRQDLRNLDMRAAATKARKLDLRQSSFSNINRHLSTISPLYKWLASQPAWAGLQNPVNGLFYSKVRGKNRRPSFNTAALNTIFSSPLFTGFLSKGHEHKPGEMKADDWR